MGWRLGVPVAVLAAGFAGICGWSAEGREPSASHVASPSAFPCGGEEVARGTGRVVDGRDFDLAGGREVRLAGIEVPLLRLPDDPPAAPGGAAARTALALLLDGAQAVLRRAEYESDRYGRTMAYVEAVSEGGVVRSVQGELVGAGVARVGGDVGNRNCAAALLRLEAAARLAKLGVWADPYYAILPADDPAAVLERRGRFALVEGSVVSVHESGAILYLNFSRYWSNEFAVTVRKRNVRKFAGAGLDLKQLAGRRVRVRGFVEQRAGARIEADRPEQIEAADRK